MQEVFEKIIEKLEEAKGNVPVNRLLDDIIKEKPKELGQLIAYDKAIEIVKQEAYKFGTDINVGSNGWIPCSERFPECENGCETTALMFQLKTGTIEVGYFGVGGKVREKYFRHYRNSTDGVDASDVVAWKPLPEPYQPKGE